MYGSIFIDSKMWICSSLISISNENTLCSTLAGNRVIKMTKKVWFKFSETSDKQGGTQRCYS